MTVQTDQVSYKCMNAMDACMVFKAMEMVYMLVKMPHIMLQNGYWEYQSNYNN